MPVCKRHALTTVTGSAAIPRFFSPAPSSISILAILLALREKQKRRGKKMALRAFDLRMLSQLLVSHQVSRPPDRLLRSLFADFSEEYAVLCLQSHCIIPFPRSCWHTRWPCPLPACPDPAMMQPGEYYNKEANLNADIRRFRHNAYTKDLMAMAGTQALSYCATSSWSPCSNEDATYDDAGIV